MGVSAASRSSGIASARWVVPVALVLVVATLVQLGAGLSAAAWSAVQVGLVLLAEHDLATRRIPNVVTVPGALAAVGLRAALDRSALTEVVVAGLAAIAVFFALSMLLRGGIGMGDVKLAGLLGFLLGGAVAPALLIGVFAGGVAGAFLLLRSKASRRSTLAYGPYLALGAAVAILAFHPPSLV